MHSTYKGHRFPPEIISYAIWLYHRFSLSFRDVEDLLAERAITVSYRKALKHQGQVPWQLVTDKLRTYWAAQCEVFPSVVHRTGRYENNRADVSHQHTREQEKLMRRFKSPQQAQRFLSVHGPNQNLFRIGRHHLKPVHYRLLRGRAFSDWQKATCVQ
jgi:putative transposase